MTSSPNVAAARRLLEPAYSSEPEWALTYGPAVADLCAAADLAPDPEQELILDGIFAVKADRPAAFEVDVIAPRQNLKTAVVLMAELGWIYVVDVRTVLHTAHRGFAVESAFRQFRRLILDHSFLSARLMPGRTHGITTGNNEQAVEFRTRQRIDYATRTADTGRSLTIERLVVDEGYAATEEQLGGIVPTMATVRTAQVVVASSAGKALSAFLRDARDRGRAGADPRQAYYEWAFARELSEVCELRDRCTHGKHVAGCALDDETLWPTFLPALGRRIDADTIRGFRGILSPAEFAREVFGVWDEAPSAAGSLFEGSTWRDLADGSSRIVGEVRFGLDVSPNLNRAAIGAAGLRADGRAHVEVTSRGGVVDAREGLSWIVPRARQLRDRWPGFKLAIAKGSQAMGLEHALTQPADGEPGIEVDVIPSTDVPLACGLFYAKGSADQLRHLGQEPLGTSVGVARKSHDDPEKPWIYGRRRSGGDLTPIYAVTYALWAANRDLAADYDVDESLY